MGQSAYRKYKEAKKTKALTDDSLPNLKSKEVEVATIKIQSAYRGFKIRKEVSVRNVANTVRAAMIIQSAYRGFRIRQQINELRELPDLSDIEVERAAVKIQAAFRGFKT